MKSLNHSEINSASFNKMVPVSAGLLSALLVAAVIYVYTQKINTEKTGSIEIPASVSASPAPDLLADNLQDEKEIKPAYPVHYDEALSELRFITVKVDVAIVRHGPSVDSVKAGWAPKGRRLMVHGEFTDTGGMKWFQIDHKGIIRWISGEVVEIAGPVASAAPEKVS